MYTELSVLTIVQAIRGILWVPSLFQPRNLVPVNLASCLSFKPVTSTRNTYKKKLYCFWPCRCLDCCRYIRENLLAVLWITLVGASSTVLLGACLLINKRSRMPSVSGWAKRLSKRSEMSPVYQTHVLHCVSGLPNFGLQLVQSCQWKTKQLTI
jgi:hypothetical protein